LVETVKALSEVDLLKTKVIEDLFGEHNFMIEKIYPWQIHLLSHQKLHLHFVILKLSVFENKQNFAKYTSSQIGQLPLPRSIDQFLSLFLS
jgi:hypothetical protein